MINTVLHTHYWMMKVMFFSTLSESESCLDFVLHCLYDRVKCNDCYKTSYNKVIFTVVIRNHCDCLTNGNRLQVNKTVWKWNTIHTRWFIDKKINGKIVCILNKFINWIFSKNGASNEKILFFIFGSSLHVRSFSAILYYMLYSVWYIALHMHVYKIWCTRCFADNTNKNKTVSRRWNFSRCNYSRVREKMRHCGIIDGLLASLVLIYTSE